MEVGPWTHLPPKHHNVGPFCGMGIPGCETSWWLAWNWLPELMLAVPFPGYASYTRWPVGRLGLNLSIRGSGRPAPIRLTWLVVLG